MFGLENRKWCLLDLVVGEDGKLVQTKVQSACFHALLFGSVASVQIVKQVAEFKGRKLEMESAPDATKVGGSGGA